MKRTKEALIAQHQSKRRESGVETTRAFSFTQLPGGSNLQKSILFFVLGLAFIAAPFILPENLGNDFFHRRAVDSVSQFELKNDVHQGQFKRTSLAGDTRPNEAATFYALSILSENPGGLTIKTEDYTDAVKQLEAKEFGKNAEKIYHGVVQLKALGLLKGSVAQQYVEKYYNLLISLAERNSAFRLDSGRSASVSATFFALKTMKELGKLEQAKKLEEFKSALNFVVSAKDAAGGFRDTPGENATLATTWQALQVLLLADQTEEVKKAYQNIADFVLSTQAKDGGFLNTPVTNNDDLLNSRSKLATTAQGLYILESLKKLGLFSPVIGSSTYYPYFEAQSYLRACLSVFHGVLSEFPSDKPDLEAAYYFLYLVNAFPEMAFGVPRSAQLGLIGVGLISLLLSVFSFYSAQISLQTVSDISSNIWATLGFLVAGALALQLYPAAAIFVYLAFSIYLTIQSYEAQIHDTSEGLIIATATANTVAYMGFVFALMWVSPFAFTNVLVFYALFAWGTIVTLLSTFGSIYLSGVKKVHVYVCAGYLSWVLNTVLLYSYLYGKGDLAMIYRLIVVQGHFPLVFVVLPFASLFLSYAASAAATVLYFRGVVTVGFDTEQKNKKRKIEAEEKSN